MSLSRRSFLEHMLAAGVAVGAADTAGITRALTISRPPRTLREKVGQVFIVSLRGLTPDFGFLRDLERHAYGGVILYQRNCQSASQIRALLTELQAISPTRLLVCVDQEGGRVTRIHYGAPVYPWEATYGQIGVPHHVYHDATRTARALRSLGLSLNLAPVVDVLANPHSPIGRRSYGRSPSLDASLALAAIRGYQHHGLAATAKHFVGLGHTSIDSHRSLPVVPLSLAQLEASDLIPFRTAIGAGVSTVLVAHVLLSQIDPYHPASLSPTVIQGVLRRRLGFQGIVMTDSLIMGAVPAGDEARAAELALAAGADVLLVAGDHDLKSGLLTESYERVLSAVQSGRIPESRLDEAVGRIQALKRRYPAL